jgi:circadian clock protein KaiB
MSRGALFKFRLYVADDTQNSAMALTNLKALCETRLVGRYEIDVVDVLLQPKRALADGIFMTPTLVKLAPLPRRTVVGTLSQMQPLLLALDLDPVGP